jgi:hypothetical protein
VVIQPQEPRPVSVLPAHTLEKRSSIRPTTAAMVDGAELAHQVPLAKVHEEGVKADAPVKPLTIAAIPKEIPGYLYILWIQLTLQIAQDVVLPSKRVVGEAIWSSRIAHFV